MAERMNKTGVDAYAQFEKWLGEQPYWLQDATYRIYHGLPIEQDQIIEYAAMCVAQAKNEKVGFKKLPQNSSKRQAVATKMSVLKLNDIVGVNALAQDASLSFSETGITVIYGLNGAGKSGFMRIFKQLSGSPYEEVIQPNVFKNDPSEKPSCVFTITEDGGEKVVPCSLSSKSKSTPLVNCDVFDTRISNDYITKTNNVSYQPFVFTVLAELSRVADKVSQQINAEINAIPASGIIIPEEFSSRQDAAWIQQLGAESVFPSKYTEWTEEQELLIENLSKKLDTEKVQNKLSLCGTQLVTVTAVLEDLTKANDSIKSDSLLNAFNIFQETKRKLKAAEKFFTEKADEQDRLSVRSDDWKSLWNIAQRYYEETLCTNGKAHFGEEGSICPLCHQTITGSIVTRFKSVNEYVNGTCSDDHKKSIAALKKLLKGVFVRAYSGAQIEVQLSTIFDQKDMNTIIDAYNAIDASASIIDIEEQYKGLCEIKLSPVIDLLKEKAASLQVECDALKKALQDEGQVQLQRQYADLRFHKWVYENRSTIESAIVGLRKTQDLRNTRPLLTTNKITSESNFLADTLITDAYIERFICELSVLAKRLKVKLEKAQSQKGSTPYKISIDTDTGIKCRPEDILSEGEQRIVALAAFFADATGRTAQTPLIIDDPISSLDYNYEDSATKRIVELAKQRQVIVFTHRISLLVGLKDLCEEENVQFTENRIRSAVKGKGVPDFEGNYYGKIPSQLNELLGRIAQIKKKDPDSEEYVDAIGRICQQFRICVERTVEDELIFGVVKRFRRKIMTNGLVKKLPAITKEDCEMIDSMMSRYSFMEHSQPAETPSDYYDIEEIEKDVKAFSDWLTTFRSRTKNL